MQSFQNREKFIRHFIMDGFLNFNKVGTSLLEV